MNALPAALLAATLAAQPVPDAVQRAVEDKLAALAIEMTPGSLERLEAPACPPYRFFLFRRAGVAQRRGVAVSDSGEVALSDDPVALGRLFAASRFFERHPPEEALRVWQLLAQSGPVLDAAAVSRLPEEARAAVFAPRPEPLEGGGVRVTGFFAQGEEIFRAQLDVAGGRALVSVKALDEILGHDEVDQAIRALRSPDEVLRAAAAFELGEKKDARAFRALVGALSDPSPNVRGTAARGLARQARLDPGLRKDALAALQKRQAAEKDPVARESLAAALSSVRAEK